MDTKVSLSSRAKLLLPKNLRLVLTPRHETPKKKEARRKAVSPVKSPVNSPVTDLALNLGELSTHGHGHDGETPKRRPTESQKTISSRRGGVKPILSMRPTVLEKQLSIDQGCCLDSPSPVDFDSPFLQSRFGALLKNDKTEADVDRMPYLKSSAFQRFQSMPVPFCGFEQSPTTSKVNPKLCLEDHLLDESSPEKPHGWTIDDSPAKGALWFSVDDEDNSQDSGLGMDRVDNRVLASDFCFVEPVAPPPRRMRVLCDETNSPHKYSPVRKSRPSPTSLHFSKESFASPIKLRKSSLTTSPDQDEGDDGFLELIDDDLENNCLPNGLDQLLSAPVLSSPCHLERTPERKCRIKKPLFFDSNSENREPSSSKNSCSRRGLFSSPSVPQRLNRSQSFDVRPRPRPYSSKRSEPCTDAEITPVQTKRRRSIIDGEKKSNPRPLQRCHSETEAMIKSALTRNDEEQDLIGDFSKPYCLPLIDGKHQDLKSITPETVAKLLNNEYSHVVEKFLIIDCRYPYEYEGGHIQGAKNIYTREGIMEEFINSAIHHNQTTCPGKRNIIIFHCEFSSERAPNLSRFLRNKDRSANSSMYPSLHFPEVYLLDGGYKNFFYSQKTQGCEPQTYKPMMHEAHSDDLKHFRQKSKSWAGEKTGRSSFRSGLKYV